MHRTGGHLQAHLQGCHDAAHCPLYTLASWDCQKRTEVLRWEGKLGAAWNGYKRASRSRSGSRHHSWTPGLRDWSGHSCCSPPNMSLRCHCGETLSLSSNTTPKLPSAVNILAYAWSSCSTGGWPGPPLMMMKWGG